jgi:AraC-like DNA-binding protein
MFVFLTAGSFTVTAGDEETRLSAGDTAVLPSAVPLKLSWDRMSKETMTMPLKAAEQAAVDLGGDGQLTFLGTKPVSPAMDRFWRSTVGFVANQLETPDSPLAEPLVLAQTLDLLGAAAVRTFPNTTMTADYRAGPGQVAPGALRRAVAFIVANADQPISARDVAAAISVSPRALQNAFVQYYGTSPLGYLHRVRLERARHDLHSTDPTTGATVSAIATRWGFPEPESFCDAYYGVYGQPAGRALSA